jgi:hypothetical protein
MSDYKSSFLQLPFAWQGAILALIMLPIWILFAFSGQSSRGEILWFLAVVIALNAVAQWNLHHQRWFWPVLVALFCVHLPLVWLDPLHGKHVMGALMTPFIFADYAFAYGVVFLARKFFGEATRN